MYSTAKSSNSSQGDYHFQLQPPPSTDGREVDYQLLLLPDPTLPTGNLAAQHLLRKVSLITWLPTPAEMKSTSFWVFPLVD